MIIVTLSAIRKLKALILEHPEDPIVRVGIKDLDEARLAFSITLERVPQPDDEIQHIDGLTVAVAASSALRLDGVTLDYLAHEGFKFLHPTERELPRLDLFNLN
ncbi:MAG: hypothetical protein HY581_09290 [Nitrospirae bacterium]|nr:hypothetical protein [Nitrospirota bacterium]